MWKIVIQNLRLNICWLFARTVIVKRTIVLILPALCFLLASCVSSDKEDMLDKALHQHVSELMSSLPQNNGPYTLVIAKEINSSTIQLDIYDRNETTKNDDDLFLDKFSQRLCASQQASALLQLGANYDVALKRQDGQVLTRTINNQMCKNG